MSDEIIKAQRIARTMDTPGWRDIVDYIKNRTEIIAENLLKETNDMEIEKCDIKQRGTKVKKTEITVVKIINNPLKHELRFWKQFLRKAADWEKLAREN